MSPNRPIREFLRLQILQRLRQTRIRPQDFLRNEAFAACGTDAAADDGDRHFVAFDDLPREEIRRRREFRRVVRRAEQPLADAFRLRGRRQGVRDGEKAHRRIIRLGDFLPCVHGFGKPQLHVGLAGRQPDIADQYVLQYQFVQACDDHLSRLGGSGHWLERRRPLAVGVRRRVDLLPGEFHRDKFARARRAVNGNVMVALQ